MESIDIQQNNLLKDESLIYQLFNLEFPLEENLIIKSELEFKVNKTWIKNNNVDVNSIKLRYRTLNDNWKLIDITKLSEDNNYIYFKSTVNSLGQFMITANEIKTIEIIENNIKNNVTNDEITNNMTINDLKNIVIIMGIYVVALPVTDILYHII